MSLIAFLFATLLASPGPAEAAACALRPVAAEHAGKIIEFRGRYGSDGRERARIDIVGCDERYGVMMVAEEAVLLIEPEMNPKLVGMFFPTRRVEALFRVRIDVVEPNTFAYQDDDGVRLTVLGVRDVVAIEE